MNFTEIGRHSSSDVKLEQVCRSGADGKRAGGKLLAPPEVVGSIPTSDTIVELDVKRSWYWM